jgi:hypothetical protein
MKRLCRPTRQAEWATVKVRFFCVGGRSMGEQFRVRVYYYNGEHSDVRRFVSAQEAGRAFQHYTNSAGAKLGSTVRVIVIDRNDCIVREWKLGQGITFPSPDLPSPWEALITAHHWRSP